MNVNFPDLSIEQVMGTKITKLAKRGVPDTPDFLRSLESSKFYSFGPSGKILPGQAQTDIQAIEENYISITILDYNLSAETDDWHLYNEFFNCE